MRKLRLTEATWSQDSEPGVHDSSNLLTFYYSVVSVLGEVLFWYFNVFSVMNHLSSFFLLRRKKKYTWLIFKDKKTGSELRCICLAQSFLIIKGGRQPHKAVSSFLKTPRHCQDGCSWDVGGSNSWNAPSFSTRTKQCVGLGLGGLNQPKQLWDRMCPSASHKANTQALLQLEMCCLCPLASWRPGQCYNLLGYSLGYN